MKHLGDPHPPNTFILDELEVSTYSKIKHMVPITSNGNRRLAWTLTNLRRNEIIENRGSRTQPRWVLSDKWKNRPSGITIILPEDTLADMYERVRYQDAVYI